MGQAKFPSSNGYSIYVSANPGPNIYSEYTSNRVYIPGHTTLQFCVASKGLRRNERVPQSILIYAAAMSSKQGGKAKPLKQPKKDKAEYDEADLAHIQKKKDEEKALKELKTRHHRRVVLVEQG